MKGLSSADDLSSEGNADLVFVQKVLLKDVSELSNFIDRSQLLASLGGYFIYCHQSWVAFIKVIHSRENKPLLIEFFLSATKERTDAMKTFIVKYIKKHSNLLIVKTRHTR